MSNSVSFSFSGDANATLSQENISAASSLSDIEKTMKSGEMGDGALLVDGSIHIDFPLIVLVLKPDGSFHGHRKKSVGTQN